MKALRFVVPVLLVLAALAVAVFSCSTLTVLLAGGGPGGSSYKDLPYASTSPSQKLDIYLPKSGEKPYPVVMWVHGGGWSGGDKADKDTDGLIKFLLARGYAVVSINYRLSGEAKFPAQIYDVKAAIRWVRAHGNEYGIDAERIGLWGGSAGGHLAALAGTSGDVAALEDLSLGNANESSRVQAVIDWFGPTDFNTIEAQAREDGIDLSPVTLPCITGLIGGNISDRQDVVAAASPETYVSADDPPFLIEQGSKDPLVPVQQSLELYDKLKAAIGPDKAEILVFPGGGHGDKPFVDQAVTSENASRLFAFLDKNIRNGNTTA